MLSSNTNKIKNFSKEHQKYLSFCCNLTSFYSKYIYCDFVEYTRLEIIV